MTREAGADVKRINLNTISREDVKDLKPGDVVLLSGKMLTGRDAAHKRMVDMINNGEELPVDLNGKFYLLRWPSRPVRDEVVGPAGPTQRKRMDKILPVTDIRKNWLARHDRVSLERGPIVLMPFAITKRFT